MDKAIPINTSLADLYPADALPTEEKRWANLRSKFESKFGHPPLFVARSPGRVNIIGEHIDYSLYDVLPTGIAADVIIAVSTSQAESGPASFSLANVDHDKFPPRTFSLESDNSVSIDASSHEWTNYFKAGLRGALPLLSKVQPDFRPVNLSVMMDGTVPAGGGLSSSAAFVCATALSVLYANGQKAIEKKSLVELAIVSERAVGVNSGGMDQSASVCSVAGNALHVSFSPKLAVDAIPFPKTDPALTFMIAQSFVAADKHVTGPVCYNLRVVEVTLAAEYVGAKLNIKLSKDSSSLGTSLRGLEDAYFASSQSPKDNDDPQARLKHMISIVESNLSSSDGYTREEIAEVLQISVPELEKQYMTTFPIRADRFLLRQRALHVFTEALRVHEFIALLRSFSANTSGDSETLLKKLGALMNDTQDSCRDVFDCSCPELDEMCDIAREAGSYGSRLTGAGWGGCSVHLVPKGKVIAIRDAWIKEYYNKKFSDMSEEKLRQAVVVSEPGNGAMV